MEDETQVVDEAGDVAREFVSEVAEAIGLDVEVEAEYEEEGDTWRINVTGEDAGGLVGRRGRTIDALQYLTVLVVQRQVGEHARVQIDAQGYRAERQRSLENAARELAAEVVKMGQEAELDPLNAFERRLIHQALIDYPGVRTYSEGEDPERRVVIAPLNPEEEALEQGEAAARPESE